MELQLLDYGTLLVFLTTVGVTQATKEPKIFRKIESGLSVGGVSVQKRNGEIRDALLHWVCVMYLSSIQIITR